MVFGCNDSHRVICSCFPFLFFLLQAGSERSDKTNVEGLSKAARAAMMEEGIAINESLRMLKSVFRILGEANKPLAKGQKAEIVQYRGNMLTELMQDSLGGNAKTLMFVNVGPAASNISESVDSLAYGDLVKNITNEKVSADADLEEQLRFLQVQRQCTKFKQRGLQAAISARPRSNDVSLWSANVGGAYGAAQTGPLTGEYRCECISTVFIASLRIRSSRLRLPLSQLRTQPRPRLLPLSPRSSPSPFLMVAGPVAALLLSSSLSLFL